MGQPEEAWKGPIDRFTFDLTAGQFADKDMELQIAALNERINKLIRETSINDIPVLGYILGLTHDPAELELLGKVLVRCAEIVPRLDALSKRKAVLDLVKEDPGWVAATFADFTSEVDAIVDPEKE